nr:hypothetical protein [Tanacetum cinerariifolium]
MVKNINNKTSKLLMYPRIVPLFDTMLEHQGEGSGTPTEPHYTPSPEADTSHPTIQYSRRARIAQSSALPTVADEPTSPVRDVNEGEACPTESGFIADQDRVTIAKLSTLPHDSAPRVTSPAADEGSMQHNISELTALCTSLQRQYSELLAKFQAQEEEIVRLKERVQVLEDREEEIARVLTSIDAATVLAGGIDVPTGSVMLVPLLVQLLQEERAKKLWWSLTLQRRRNYKNRLMPSLDKSNETIAKYLQEYQEFASKLPLEKRIELISDLVKYQDNYSKVYKFQSQQRRPMTKKQKREYYMAVIKSNLGWRLKDFKGMTFKGIEAKFAKVWKQVENFISIGSKEETERLKRKGLNLEKEQEKKQKLSKEAPEIKHPLKN